MKHCYSCGNHWDRDNWRKDDLALEGQREQCPKCYSDDTGVCVNENKCNPFELRKREMVKLHFAKALEGNESCN